MARVRPPSARRPRFARRQGWAVVGGVLTSMAVTAPAFASGAILGDRNRMPARSRNAFQSTSGGERRVFEVAAGSLDAALRVLETLTGVRITVRGELTRGMSTAGVAGTMTVEQALQALLTGTGLTARFTSPVAVTIELRIQGEAVEVAGVAGELLSSTKYVAPLRDIPQTIEIIPRALMEQQGVRTLSEALRNVPGISLQAGEGGGASSTAGDMFNMRGFSANNSLFVDGVRNDGLVSRDVFNLDQVEVFLGPTGSDVGRGTAAGYVNMASKTPRLGAAYATSFAYGAADQKRLTADVNHGLSSRVTGGWRDRAAIRLNGLWDEGGVPGRDVVTRKNQAIAPSVTFGLGTATRVTGAAQISRQENTPDYGVSSAGWNEPLAPTVTLASKPVASSHFYGSIGYDYDRVEQENYTARVEHDVKPDLNIRNQTRHNHTLRTAVVSTVQSPTSFNPLTETLTIARQGNERENDILSNVTAINGRFTTRGLRHAANAGLEFSNEHQFAPTLTGLGTPRVAVNIYDPNPFDPILAYAPVRSPAYSRGRTNNVAVYGFDSVDLGRHWQVSGGLRWEHYRTTFLTVDAAGLTTVDQTAADRLVSGKAALMYRVRTNTNVYVSYGTSVTPPGTTNFTLSAQANNQNNPNVEPQASANLEVGAKWGLFDDRLALNVAAFRTRNRNVIFTVDAAAAPPVFNQNDAQKVDGVTAGVTGRITERWDISANIGYLDSSLETQNSVDNGNQLLLTPPLSGSLWTTFRAPGGLTIGGGVRHSDAVFVNAANTIRVPSYRLVDGLVEYGLNTHLTFRLNVSNLANAIYIRNVNNNGGRYNPGTPRAAVLSSNVTF